MMNFGHHWRFAPPPLLLLLLLAVAVAIIAIWIQKGITRGDVKVTHDSLLSPSSSSSVFDKDFGELIDSKPNPQILVSAFYDFESNENRLLPEHSSERVVLQIATLVYVKINGSNSCKLYQEKSSTFEAEINKSVALLNASLTRELFNAPNFTQFLKVQKSFEEIARSPLEAFAGQKFWNTPYGVLLKTIRPLDTFRVLYLLEKAKELERLFTQMNDSTVIFLIGLSGGGKSTSLHYMSGSSFILQYVEDSGIFVVSPSKVEIEEAKQIAIGHDPSSETLYVVAVPVIPSDLKGNSEGRSENKIYICDSPGFFDSRGAEIEISNGIGTVNAIKKAGKVYLSVVIRNDRAGKWRDIKGVSKVLQSFIPNLSNYINGSFSYIFSREFDTVADPKKFIHSEMVKLRSEAENSDIDFILADIERKTKGSRWNRAFILSFHKPDILASKHSNVLPGDMVQAIINGNPITDGKAFQNFLTPNTEETISKQILVHKHVIKAVSLAPDVDFDILNFHLTQLSIMQDSLERDEYGDAYDFSINLISSRIKEYIELEQQLFLNHLFEQTYWIADNFDQEELLFKNDINRYLNCFSVISKAKVVLGSHFDALRLPFPEHYYQSLGNSSKSSFSEILSIEQASALAFFYKLPFGKLQARLDRLKVAKKRIISLEEVYKCLIGILDSKVGMLTTDFNFTINSWQTSELVEYFDAFYGISVHLSNHLQSLIDYDSQVKIVTDKLSDDLAKVESMFKGSILKQDDWSSFQSVSSRFDEIISSKQLFSAHHGKFWNQTCIYHKIFLGNTTIYCRKTVELLNSSVTHINEENVGLIHSYVLQVATFANVSSLMKYDEMRNDITNLKVQSQILLREFLLNGVQSFEEDLLLLTEWQATRESNQRLATSLLVFEKADWIEEYYPQDYGKIKSIKEKIVSSFQRMLNGAKKCEISYENYSMLDEIARYYHQSLISKELEKRVVGIASILQELDNTITRKRAEGLSTISNLIPTTINLFEKPSDDRLISDQQVDCVNKYFQLISQLQLLEENELSVKTNFQNFLKLYAGEISKLMDLHFSIFTVNKDNLKEEDVEEAALSFDLRFEEITKLESVNECIRELYLLWTHPKTGKLVKYSNSLQKKHQNHIDSTALLTPQQIQRSWKAINYLVHYDEQVGMKFSLLETKYLELMRTQKSTLLDNAKSYLDKFKYVKVKNLLETNNKTPETDTIIESVEDHMSGLKSKIQKRFTKVTIDELSKFADDFSHLKQATVSLASYLHETEQQKYSNQFFNTIAQTVSQNIQIYSQIDGLLYFNNFVESEARIDAMGQIREILATAELQTIQININGTLTDVDISNIYNEMKTQVDKRITVLVGECLNMSITLNYAKIESIYLSLKPLIEKNEQYRQYYWKRISDAIEFNTLQTIQDIQSNKHSWTLAKRAMELKRLESAVAYWTFLKDNSISHTISNCRQTVETSETNFQTDIENAMVIFVEGPSDLFNQLRKGEEQKYTDLVQKHKTDLDKILLNKFHEFQKLVKENSSFQALIQPLTFLLQCHRYNNDGNIVSPNFKLLMDRIIEALQQLFKQKLEYESKDNAAKLSNYYYVFDALVSLEMSSDPDLKDFGKSFYLRIEIQVLNAIKDLIQYLSTVKSNLGSTLQLPDFQSVVLHLDSLKMNVAVLNDLSKLKSKKSTILSSLETVEFFSFEEGKTLVEDYLKENYIKPFPSSLNDLFDLSRNHHDREVLYQEVFTKLQNIKHFEQLAKDKVWEADFEAIFVSSKQLNEIEKELMEFHKKLAAIVKKTSPKITEDESREFQVIYDHFIVVQEKSPFKELKDKVSAILAELTQEFKGAADAIVNDINKEKAEVLRKRFEQLDENQLTYHFTVISNGLCILNELRQLHATFEAAVDNSVRQILAGFAPKDIYAIGQKLAESSSGYDLTNRERSTFEANLNEIRKKQTADMNIVNALELLIDVDEKMKKKLKNEYDKYERTYLMLVQNQLGYRDGLDRYINDQILKEISKKKISKAKVSEFGILWDANTKETALLLLPYIMALKTVRSFASSWAPHPVQIFSILRIFLSDWKKTAPSSLFGTYEITLLSNHLLQIGTGEGKSVTLAATASILALLGYDVNIACYSKYLSQRDADEFNRLFVELEIPQNQIQYDTFYSLVEGFINEKGDIRDKVTNYVLTDTNLPAASIKSDNRPKVLLIDEVDIFLSPQFYSETYDINAKLIHEQIFDLMYYLWKESSSLAYDVVLASKPYENCVKSFPKWKFLFEASIREMLFSLDFIQTKAFVPYHWDLKSQQIGYKVDDGISYSITQGYETDFFYFYEYEKNSLSIDDLKKSKKVGINLDAGSFLYVKFLDKFAGIMGVTGTLNSLIEPQKKLLKDRLLVKSESYIPSAYGQREKRFHFSPNDKADLMIIRSNSTYDNDLYGEIMKRMQDLRDASSAKKRAVIVFFATRQRLEDFYKASQQLYANEYRIQKMLEQDTISERNNAIRNAVKGGTVTLAVREYGRGTDFICHDTDFNARGGVHVIQTFFSDDKSEEIQIQGRTARNTNDGSYSMVLLQDELMKQFNCTSDKINEIVDSGKIYDHLDRLRQLKTVKQIDELNIKPENEQIHSDSMKLRDDNLQVIIPFIKNAIDRRTSFSSKRVVFSIDYSGSMYGSKISSAVNNLLRIFRFYISINDYISLVMFSGTTWTEIPMMIKGGNEQVIDAKISSLTDPDGGTAFYDSVLHSIKLIEEDRLKNSILNNDWIVALSDGDDNSSEDGSFDELLQKLKTANIGIVVIGVGESLNKVAFEQIAGASGKYGEFISTTDETTSIAKAFGQVAKVIQGKAKFNKPSNSSSS